MIIYRQATTGDEGQIADLHNGIIRNQYGPVYGKAATEAWASHDDKKWRELITSDQSDFFVAVDKTEIVGCAGLNITDERLGVYVAQSHQRQGIARHLMDEQLKKAKIKGIKKLNLSAPEAAVDFYVAMGFKLSGPEQHTFNNGATITVYNMSIDL